MKKKKKKRKTSQNYCHEKTGRRERRTLKKKTINIRLTNQSKWRTLIMKPAMTSTTY